MNPNEPKWTHYTHMLFQLRKNLELVWKIPKSLERRICRLNVSNIIIVFLKIISQIQSLG